jgi:predicted Fe-Mo cluster-binding NifX family protein
MKIAVASQNRREVTGHTGRCRKFWFYDIEQGQVLNKILLELPKEQSLHDSSRHASHPLEIADVLISAGMGQGLVRRLEAWGIEAVVTPEPNPDVAVAHYLAGTLPPGGQNSQCSCHES